MWAGLVSFLKEICGFTDSLSLIEKPFSFLFSFWYKLDEIGMHMKAFFICELTKRDFESEVNFLQISDQKEKEMQIICTFTFDNRKKGREARQLAFL